MISYRIILLLVSPVLALVFGWRWLTGKETRSTLAERLALSSPEPEPGQTIWLHAASLGELTAARPLLTAILARWPKLRIVVTMNSSTGRTLVRNWQDPRIEGQLAPLDFQTCIRRFCKQWSPLALISVENELWPNRLSHCRRIGIPVLVAGGRISERAHSTWSRFPALARSVMTTIDHLAPLDSKAAESFVSLGLDPKRVGKTLLLKSAVALPDPDPADLARLAERFDRRRTVLAASTHENEETLILRAFITARREDPELRLILAPRHPARGDEIARALQSVSLDFDRRSVNGVDIGRHPVLLADTLGEMALWYSVAGITLIGGTWVAKGGHTPFEPAQFNSAMVHGPSIWNHADAFGALDAAGGAVAAQDETQLASAVLDLSQDHRQQTMTRAANRALAGMRKETTGIDDFVDQLATLADR